MTHENLPDPYKKEVLPDAMRLFANTWHMKYIYSTLMMALLAMPVFAQIAVTQNSNSQALSQLLAGSGVTISNFSLQCSTNGSGTFTNTGTNLGMPGGVILSSGRVQNVPNAASVFASTQFTASGDAQLSTLTTGSIYDPCVLQFDIVPQGPLLKFDYVFASEEYPEWVCSQFNDVFGFFITGPNPGGGNYTNQNMALIPGTNLPVAINTVNPGSPGANANGGTCSGSNRSLAYSSLYTNNQVPLNTQIVYDGMTHLLTATAAVTPCQVYHLKIAIADVADRIYDSGVFLSAYSFNANPVSISALSSLDYAGFSSAYEGCVGGTFTLTLTQPQAVDLYVNLLVSGTATNGVDYAQIPTTVLIPAGQTTVTIPLTPTADGLTEGVETVTVATLNPCTGGVSASASINIRDDVATSIDVIDSTLCLGQSTQLTANGGVTFSWTPTTGLSNPNIRNPIASPTTTTTYTCSMQFGSCIKTVSQTIYVSQPTNSITASPTGTICNGGTVQLTSVPTSGPSPFTYLWSTGAITPQVTVAAGGNYTVTARDAYGCSATATTSLTISNLSITGVATNVTCIGGNNGTIDITVTGANAPFTYNWGGGVVSQDRANLVAGTYTVTASNTVGCSVSASYTVGTPASTITSSATNNAVTCNGGSNGNINLIPSGGATPYVFAWSNAATTEDLNNIAAGSYTVTITDNNGCTATRTVNITQPSAVTTSETHVNVTCQGLSNGSIDLTVSGGTGAYTYAWNTTASTQDITALAAGTYGVTVADANGCTVNRSVTITQPAVVSGTLAVTTPACFGNSNGSINLTAAGGTAPYTYIWSNAATTQNISGLPIGTYNVTITDVNGCSGSASATLTQPAVLQVSAAKTDVSCNGGNNGTITTTVTGGTTPYTYNWGGGVTTANRTNLTSGTYTVTVTDARGCTATATAIITQPAALTLAETHTNATCNGSSTGSIDITTTGGTSPYTFNWGGGVITEDRSNLAAGTYTITTTDSRACSATLSISITQPTAPSVTLTPVAATCNGTSTGSITATAGGGTSPYTFVWNDGNTSQNRTGLSSGTYTITVTDNRGCTVSGSTSVTQPTAIAISPTSTNATCAVGNDGAISLSVSGGNPAYTYNWGGGITTQNRSGLTAGSYPVTVTDAAGCSASLAVAVSQTGSGISLSSVVTNVSCNGGGNGAIDITLTGGSAPITYNWGGGITTQDRTGLTAGSYSVTVTDGLGCSAVSSNNVTQPTALAITKTSTNILCNGANTGSITIAVTGGTGVYTYNWGAGVTTQNRAGIAAGTYTVTVTDANGCTATNSTTITQPAVALSVSTTSTAVPCFGGNTGSVTTTITGGTTPYTFNWNNGSINQNLSNVIAGTYNITVTDVNGCTSTATRAVSQPAAALNTALTAANVACNGSNAGGITNNTTGGTTAYSFIWNDGATSQNRAGIAAGSYAVTVTDNNSCSTTAAITITQPVAINITLASTNVSCAGGNNGSITTTVTGGTGAFTYNWGSGVTTANRTNLVAGTYSITATDASGCTATASRTITEPAPLTVSMNSGTSVCNTATGTAAVVTNGSGTGPYSYSWSNLGPNNQSQNGLPPGPISVTVTDGNGCTSTGSVTVGLSGNNTNAAYTYTGVPCGPGAAYNFTHTGSNNVTHFWDFGNGTGTSTSPTPTYTFPAYGTFQVNHVVTRGYCQDSLRQTITIYPKPGLTSVNTNVSCNGQNNGAIDLSVGVGTAPFTYNWGSGITTQDRSSLAPGTYTVTVTDARPCSSTLSVAITQPAVLTVTNTNINVTCAGNGNGAITLTVTGGTTAYSYNWGSGVTTQNRAGLSGGTYVVTVTDANNCTNIKTISLFEPSPITITANVTDPACNGQSNGSINLIATGGTGTLTYSWAGGATTQNRTGLSAGTYSVTVRDANACSSTASITVTQPGVLAATTTTTNVQCNGGNDGTINTTTTGGTAPYSYTWNDGNVNENRNYLTAGTYTVVIYDLNNCSTTASATVTQPSTAVALTVSNVNSVNCYGDSTGTANVSASGGNPAYTFAWSDGSSLQNRTNLMGGLYHITVSDSRGCQATGTANINQPSQGLSIDTFANVNVLCYGGATGSISPNIIGGTGPYTYIWNDGATTLNRTNIPAGNFRLTVTDTRGCSAIANDTITQPSAALAASTAVTNIGCFGGSTGSINLTPSGGTSPYTFNWGGGIITEDRSGLAAGTYIVVVTDSNNCTVSKSATVTQATSLTATVASTTNVSCFGGSNGAINITVTGGTTAYSFNWGSGVTTQNRTGLAAGTYTVSVTDANACSTTASATITQPAAALSASIASSTNIMCYGANNGTINVTVTGGTTAYSYNWGSGVTTQNRTGLAAGIYTLTVTDANSCTATTSATITSPAAALSATTVVTNVSCAGNSTGAINLTPAGGTTPYTFNWGGGVTAEDRTNLAAGTYTVTITDANSCTLTKSATITQPATLTATVASTANVSCFGGSNGAINITVTGGTTAYSFNWGSGITTQNRTGLAAGTYTVSVTDANACSTTASATITQPASALSATVASSTNIMCYGANNGTINVTVTGGTTAYSYNWGAGVTTQNRTGLAAGTYTLTVTDANSCTATTSATITSPAAALSATTVVTNISCAGNSTGAINLTPAGGTTPYTFNWGGGVTTEDRINLAAGTYIVTITDANSCALTKSATITQPATLTATIASTTNVSCFGGSNGAINITVTGGTTAYSFNWGSGITTQNRTGLNAGTYTVSVTDANACSTTASATITQPASALSASVASSTNIMCYGANNGTINVTVTGGTTAYSFNWGSGVTTQNRTGLAAGTYTLTVTDANSCTATTSATITSPAAALSATTVVTSVSCAGNSTGTIDLTASGGTTPYAFNWGSGVTTEDRNNLAAGTYTVTITDANSCTLTKTATVTQPATLTATVASTTNVSCFGGNNGAINITVTGGTTAYSFNWGSGVTTQNRIGLTAGTYTVSVTDANACSTTASATITQPAAALSVSVASSTNIMCYGANNGTINVTVTGGTTAYSFNWGGGVTTQNRTGLAAGTYTLTVTDANNCTATTSATITSPAAALSATTVVTSVSCAGNSTGTIDLTAAGGTSPYAFNWGSGVTTEDRNNLAAGTYTVTITDANSCTLTKTATVTQPATLTATVASTTNVSCFGGSNGAINIAVTGGTTAYSFNWGSGITTQNRTGLVAGTYTVSVTDANACTTTASATITQPASALSASVASSTNIMCYGANNGTINVTVTGGTTAYSYNWGSGVTTQNRTGLAAGTYTLTVTDANSCTTTTSATITSPASAISATTVITNVSCAGNSTGTIDLTTIGGTSPYAFNWGGGVTTEDRNNLLAGTYTVTITDANSCTLTKSATVTQAPVLTAVIAPTTNVSCFGGSNGSMTLTALGGTPFYSYNWGGGVTTQNRTNLTAGTYQVIVTDVNGCSTSASATITQPATALSASVVSTTNIACYGGNTGTITTNVNGGTANYNYNWGGGVTTQNRTGLTAGTYTLTVTDANSCTATASATITQPSSGVSVTITTLAGVQCYGGNNGSINVSATGGTGSYTYNWNDGSSLQNRTGLTAGTYVLTLTDGNGCSATTNALVNQPTVLQATAAVTNVSCNGGDNGAIALAISGGTPAYSVLWSNGATTRNINTLLAGTYTVTVTDAHSCSLTRSAQVTEPTVLVVTHVTTDVRCNGGNTGAIDNTITGGTPPYASLWNTSHTSEDLQGVVAGNYATTITDANHCTAVIRDTIIQPAALGASLAGTNPRCLGSTDGSINLTVTGGTTPMQYIWTTGVTVEDPANLGAGSYSVMITDANNCTLTGTTTLAVINPLLASEAHTDVTCYSQNDGVINVAAIGGATPYTYLWSNGAAVPNIGNLSPGSYSVTITDNNGCTAGVGAVTITEPAGMNLTIASTNIACYGTLTGSISPTVTGGTLPYHYQWNNNSQASSLPAVAAGSYSVTVTDAHGCSQVATALITSLPALTGDAIVDPLPCTNATGGIDLNTGGGTAPYSYQWNNGVTTEDLSSVHPGAYTVVITDANGCTFDTTFVITNLNSFTVSASGGGTITLGQTIDLHATSTGSSETSYNWTPTYGMPCSTCSDITIQPSHPTLYTVIGVDTNGCIAQDTVSVDVIEDHTLFPPNAFTPNGDGNNDVFQLFGNLAGIKKFNIKIFDRWGELVYESDEPSFSWDGTYKGQLIGPTVCVFVMQVTFLDGYNDKVQKGSITVLR